MTLTELLEASHRKIMTLEEYQWQCFGDQAALLTMGTPEQHIASAVIDKENLRIYALEIPGLAQWTDPEYRDSYRSQLAKEGLTASEPELAENSILALLAEITE